jgi:hypothetical protein
MLASCGILSASARIYANSLDGNISAFLKIVMLSTRVAWVATYLTARTTSCGRS